MRLRCALRRISPSRAAKVAFDKEFAGCALSRGCAYLLRLHMNVVVESQPNCLVTLRVELPSDQVSKEWSNVARDFQRQARIPGYRPGKAPQALVESRFAKDIKEELTSKLLRESLNEAIREKNLRVLSVSQVENVEIADDRTMRYRATVVTAPEFELPDYSSIPADIAKEEVTDESVQRWIDQLREPHASYAAGRRASLWRWATMPWSPTRQALKASRLARPFRMRRPSCKDDATPGSSWTSTRFCRAFAQSIVGMNVNEERTISHRVARGLYSVASLAGKKLDYAVTLHAINTKVLPELDDALAEKIEPGATADQLRAEGARAAGKSRRGAVSKCEEAGRREIPSGEG